MQTGSIKISELNPMTSSIVSEDFLPLVDSSSMTTFRASMAQIASAVGGVSSSLYASQSQWAVSASWASSSLSASYALTASFASVAGRVNLSQAASYIPIWNSNAANSNLGTSDSDLYRTQSKLVVNAAHSLAVSQWTDAANYIDGYSSKYPGGIWSGGIFSAYPIISTSHIGADQKYWLYDTSSNANTTQYYSGSGAWIPIPAAAGGIAGEFNGKWVRVAAVPYYADNDGFVEQHTTANNPAFMREMHGRIRLETRTSIYGSNSHNIVDMEVHNTSYGGSIAAIVTHHETFGPRILNKIRICKSYVTQSSDPNEVFDPHLYIDVYVDNLEVDDYVFILQTKSYFGAIRFVDEPTFGPFPPVNEGATLAAGAYRIEFVPNVGTYQYLPDHDYAYECRDQIISGRRLRIDPRNSTITESRRANYTLEVSGTVGANGYYNKDEAGQDATVIVYNPTTSAWSTARFSGGILVASASAGGSSPTSSVNIYGNVPVGTIIDYAGGTSNALTASGWYPCDGSWFSQSAFPEAYTALGEDLNPWGTSGAVRSGWDSTNGIFRVPDLRKRCTIGAYPGDPEVTYKSDVGNTGGHEDFMRSHYHYFATRYEMVDYYDNLIFQWATKNVTATGHASSTLMDTSKMVQEGRTYWFLLDGDLSDSSAVRRDTREFRSFASDRSWDLVTSYPYQDGATNEVVPPYAVVNKLIRLR